MSGGITATGFNLPTMTEIEEELRAALLANVSASQDLSSDGPMGQIVSIFARQIVQAWEALATAYGSADPDAAEGVQLDNICALTGVLRDAATRSLVTCNLSLNAVTTVPAGSVIAVAGQPNLQFELVADVTSTVLGVYPGVFQATVVGPVPANAGTLTSIVTPVSGWTAVTNPLDATLGTNTETDTALRVRRLEEITRPGAATANAIRADVLAVAGVLQCKVYENYTEATDADGVPAKSFETLVWDGNTPVADNTEIVTAIYGSKPAGIRAHGTTTVLYTDDSDNEISIGFTRAVQRQIYVDITVVTNENFDAVDGPLAIKELIAAKGNQQLSGDDVIALQLRAESLLQEGVVDATVFELGFSASPSGTANLVIGSREIARFDTARITVTVT